MTSPGSPLQPPRAAAWLVELFASPQEADGLLGYERRHRVLLLGADVQRLAARHQHAEVGAGPEQAGHPGGRIPEVLKVVEQEEQRLVADVCCQAALGRH